MAKNDIALLGAGFSHNWGAPLASEVANWLLAQVGSDPYLQGVLKQHERNFENALSQIQEEYSSSPSSPEARERFYKLQTAITVMFDNINASLKGRDFEFSQERRFSVQEFLFRFDAIFGVNQDLLLEFHYEDSLRLASNSGWHGLQKPGMNPVHGYVLKGRCSPAPPPFKVERGLQPYFKMHGSSNWYTNDGRNLIVMGGRKDSLIRRSDLLSWYYDQFRSYLSRPATRLMVIGYSFSDPHINDAVVEAWRRGNLNGIFLVNPNGRDALNNKGLDDIHSLGGSTRLFSATFAGDEFEHQKFIKFFR